MVSKYHVWIIWYQQRLLTLYVPPPIAQYLSRGIAPYMSAPNVSTYSSKYNKSYCSIIITSSSFYFIYTYHIWSHIIPYMISIHIQISQWYLISIEIIHINKQYLVMVQVVCTALFIFAFTKKPFFSFEFVPNYFEYLKVFRNFLPCAGWKTLHCTRHERSGFEQILYVT